MTWGTPQQRQQQSFGHVPAAQPQQPLGRVRCTLTVCRRIGGEAGSEQAVLRCRWRCLVDVTGIQDLHGP